MCDEIPNTFDNLGNKKEKNYYINFVKNIYFLLPNKFLFHQLTSKELDFYSEFNLFTLIGRQLADCFPCLKNCFQLPCGEFEVRPSRRTIKYDVGKIMAEKKVFLVAR